MLNRLRHTAAVSLLLLHSIGVVAAEFGHIHHASARLPVGASVATHDCGSHERHIAPDRVIPCPACSPGSVRLGLPASIATAPALASRTEIPPFVPPASIRVSRSACGERAPPRVPNS